MVGCVVNSIVTYTKQIKFHDYSTWLGDKLNLIFVTDKLFMIHDILSVSFISMVIQKISVHCHSIDVFLSIACFALDK